MIAVRGSGHHTPVRSRPTRLVSFHTEFDKVRVSPSPVEYVSTYKETPRLQVYNSNPGVPQHSFGPGAVVAFHCRLNFQGLAVAQHRELGDVADSQERHPVAQER
jgi:hypothetical protein